MGKKKNKIADIKAHLLRQKDKYTKLKENATHEADTNTANIKLKQVEDGLAEVDAFQQANNGNNGGQQQPQGMQPQQQMPMGNPGMGQPQFARNGGHLNMYPDGGYLTPEGYAAINKFENTSGTFDKLGNPIGMGKGDNYAQTGGNNPQAVADIENFIDKKIGKNVWDKMPEEMKVQAYSFMFNHGIETKDKEGDLLKGIAQAIQQSDPDTFPETYGDDGAMARGRLSNEEALKIVKEADYSNPTIYNNYVNVLGSQLDSLGLNFPEGYREAYGNRAIDINNYYDKPSEQGNSPSNQPPTDNAGTTGQGDLDYMKSINDDKYSQFSGATSDVYTGLGSNLPSDPGYNWNDPGVSNPNVYKEQEEKLFSNDDDAPYDYNNNGEGDTFPTKPYNFDIPLYTPPGKATGHDYDGDGINDDWPVRLKEKEEDDDDDNNEKKENDGIYTSPYQRKNDTLSNWAQLAGPAYSMALGLQKPDEFPLIKNQYEGDILNALKPNYETYDPQIEALRDAKRKTIAGIPGFSGGSANQALLATSAAGLGYGDKMAQAIAATNSRNNQIKTQAGLRKAQALQQFYAQQASEKGQKRQFDLGSKAKQQDLIRQGLGDFGKYSEREDIDRNTTDMNLQQMEILRSQYPRAYADVMNPKYYTVQ